jgi:hypothetical protein
MAMSKFAGHVTLELLEQCSTIENSGIILQTPLQSASQLVALGSHLSAPSHEAKDSINQHTHDDCNLPPSGPNALFPKSPD